MLNKKAVLVRKNMINNNEENNIEGKKVWSERSQGKQISMTDTNVFFYSQEDAVGRQNF